MAKKSRAVWEWKIVKRAIWDSFLKLNPRKMMGNPVMFVVEVGSVITTALLFKGGPGFKFNLQITLWLWFTVVFANFAEAMAEGRGKAQADTLRRARRDVVAKKVLSSEFSVLSSDDSPTQNSKLKTQNCAASDLRKGDVVLVEAGDFIPGDGEVIEGVASVDESAITGESAPVIRESGGDRSAVTGGTRVLSDWIRVRITSEPGKSFLDRMIALVEGAERQKTPNEIALSILLSVLTIIFLVAVVTLQPFAVYSGRRADVVVLIALLVCLIPTTIGALLSAIGIAGMDRMVQHNVLAMSGRAVEAAGDVNTLLLDKTGTITLGNRQATEFIPVGGHTAAEVTEAALRSSLADDTPEGRSIVALAEQQGFSVDRASVAGAEFIPFSAETRMSGIALDGRRTMKGAVDAVSRLTDRVPVDLQAASDRVAGEGGTPLAVMDRDEVLGVIYLKDTIKPGLRPRFDELRTMGIRTVMVTGDNPLTAKTIAGEAGVEDFLAEITPEQKLAYVREEQAKGHLLAMTGDGTNDAPALAQADVGLAMNSGTSAAKEAGNMVDLDSNPTKLIEVVAIGKQLLITRGAITTFSIANDVAKYFAIIPAAFVATYPELGALNIMRLATPESAILSAVIFNALIIIALIPLALKGVAYRAVPAAEMLSRNLLVYGLGGVIAPFVGIKLIDMILVALHWV